MIGQVKLVGEVFAAILTRVRTGFGVLDHNVPKNAIFMRSGHVAQNALKHSFAFCIRDGSNEFGRT